MQTPKKLTVKRVVLSLIYALIIYLVGLTLYVSISIHTCMVLYDYKESIYQQELNFLFRKEVLPTLGAKYVYKYKNKAGIYFMEQNGNNITIVECSNFKNIDLENVQIIENVEIESTNRITYVQYYHPPFAAVQQASKPKKSSYLNVVIDNKDPIPMKSIGKKSIYIGGYFFSSSLSNSINCSIIRFTKKGYNEIIIIKSNDKLYFITQSLNSNADCLLNIINPIYLN